MRHRAASAASKRQRGDRTCASVIVLAWIQANSTSGRSLRIQRTRFSDHRLAILKFQQTVIVAEVNVVVARDASSDSAANPLCGGISASCILERSGSVCHVAGCQRDDIDLIPVGLSSASVPCDS